LEASEQIQAGLQAVVAAFGLLTLLLGGGEGASRCLTLGVERSERVLRRGQGLF
jgi:hypothetical protein